MTNSEFIEGINIIGKYMPEDSKEDCDRSAEHDQFWFGDYDWVPEGKDRERLLGLGWFDDEDSWSCFA